MPERPKSRLRAVWDSNDIRALRQSWRSNVSDAFTATRKLLGINRATFILATVTFAIGTGVRFWRLGKDTAFAEVGVLLDYVIIAIPAVGLPVFGYMLLVAGPRREASLNRKLAPITSLQEQSARLVLMGREGGDLRKMILANMDEPRLDELMTEFESWCERVFDYIRDNLTVALAEYFDAEDDILPPGRLRVGDRKLSERTQWLLQRLAARLKHLSEIMAKVGEKELQLRALPTDHHATSSL